MIIEIRDSGSSFPVPSVETVFPGREDGACGIADGRSKSRRDDRELFAVVARARAEDLEAQSELVRRYRPRITGYVRPILSSADGVDDVVQNVFVKMIRRLGALRDPAVFESWLFTLARNAALDSLRRARCRPVTVASEADWLEVPDASLADRSCEILEALEVVTQGWDGRSRRMLTYILNGTDYDVIARSEGLSVGAIKLRLHRLRLRLRQNLRIALGEERGSLSMC